MKLAQIQMRVGPDKAANLRHAEALLSRAADADMAVLKNIEITQPDQLVVEETDNQPVSCYGESDGSAAVAAAGGTAPYTYDWLDRHLPCDTLPF